jgi:hypothetical protein
MRKLGTLMYLLGFPIALGQVLPGIFSILIWSAAPAGIVPIFGLPAALFTTTTVFSYFISGFFPTPSISNLILGL